MFCVSVDFMVGKGIKVNSNVPGHWYLYFWLINFGDGFPVVFFPWVLKFVILMMFWIGMGLILSEICFRIVIIMILIIFLIDDVVVAAFFSDMLLFVVLKIPPLEMG